MPDCYNENNITKYITSTLSLIFRAEYPTFVNHMITNTFSNIQGILPAHYTCIYFVLLSIAPNIHHTEYYPFVSLTFRAEYLTFVNHMIANTVSNTQGILQAHYTCIYLVLLSIAPNIHQTEYSPFVNHMIANTFQTPKVFY